jgi:hypothetical protein
MDTPLERVREHAQALGIIDTNNWAFRVNETASVHYFGL